MSGLVMVVDDDIYNRNMLRLLLELEGYLVSEAEDGLDALHKATHDVPDAMILDVMMPNMDGIAACRALRARQETSRLPIIMLSGKTQIGSAEEGLAAGANVYLSKPTDMDELLSTLRYYAGGTARSHLHLI